MKKVRERNENPQLIKKYNIMSYPTVALLKDKKFITFDGDKYLNIFQLCV